MDNLVADFTININEPLQAEFVLGNSQTFDCSFELFAAGTVWGSIDGDISNQTDLQNALNLKADKTDLDADVELINQTINENYNDLSGQIEDLETVVADNYTALENDLTSLSTTVDDNYSELSNRLLNDEQTTSDLIETVADNYTELNGKISTNTGNITSIQNTINSYGDIVSYNATDFATASQGALADTALQSGDNITELVNNAGYITSADLPTLEDLTTQAQMNAINSGATSGNIAQIASNTQAISTETTNRQNADNNLQSQIDAITASSDVTDIVGTYAQLQAYDTSTLAPNSIIKVLQDEHENNETTYYRWVITGGVGSWVLIGEEGPYYTKSEADGRFVPQTRTVNGKALSNNITLDATDVGALPSSTVIPIVNDGTLTIQVNGTSVGTFTANQSGNTTANIVVPDSATWGNITGDIADQTDLQDALADKQDKLTAGIDLEIVVGSGASNTVSGTGSVTLSNAAANSLSSVIVYGKCSQTGTPTTSNPIDILCNNGAIKYNTSTSTFYADGTVETVTDSLGNTATAEMLLGFGDYVDTQDLLGVSGTRKVGLMVLTGTEEFDTNTLSNCYSLTNALGSGNLTDRTVYCTHFRNSSTLPAAANRQGYALIGNKSTPSSSYTVGFGATSQFSTVALFKSWLATQYANGTPVIIAYPLTNPTTFSASAQTLNTKSGSNQLIISQSAISNLNIKATYTTESSSTINFTNDTGYITGITSSNVTNALGYTPVNPSSLAAVATSGDYDDLTNKPTIPTVGDGTITITQGGVTKGTFTTNQSGNSTIALDAGGGSSGVFIAEYEVTTFAEVQTAVNADKIVMVNYNSEEYILSGVVWEDEVTISCYTFSAFSTDAYPSDQTLKCISLFSDDEWGIVLNLKLATTNTAQNIISRKTFIGEKAIYFKQLLNTDKLGFTLYNTSNTELGAFEYRPNTVSGNALLNVNTSYSNACYVGFRYWGTAVNIIAPKVATAGDYYIPVNITDGNTTVTANSSGTVDISSLLPSGGGIQNTATGTNSLTILGTPTAEQFAINIGNSSSVDEQGVAIGNSSTSGENAIAIGYQAYAGEYGVAIGGYTGGGQYDETAASHLGTAIGSGASASNTGISIGFGATDNNNSNSEVGNILIGARSYTDYANTVTSSIAIGSSAAIFDENATGTTITNAIQLGSGANGTSNTFQVWEYPLLVYSTGLIPDARLSSNIARTSQIPSLTGYATQTWVGQQGYLTSISSSNVTSALGYTPSDNTLSNVSSIDSSSAVQTALDTKLNTSDVWYDSTTSTLNIGIAQV